MEMPVQCIKCDEVVELNSTRHSPISKQLLCEACFSVEDEVNDLMCEARDIKYGLDNYADYMKGDRRGWKRNLKELKAKVIDLGFDFDDLLDE